MTTDRTDTAGYHQVTTASGGDYTTLDGGSSFGGTSAATPLAAGIGALLLSRNPGLTAADVRSIMQNTADKVGGNNV